MGRQQLSEAQHIHADANAKLTKYKSYRDKNILAPRFFSGSLATIRTIRHLAGSPSLVLPRGQALDSSA
jgi:hypothetical protein